MEVLSLVLLIVAAIFAAVEVFQSPRSLLAWAVLLIAVVLLLPQIAGRL